MVDILGQVYYRTILNVNFIANISLQFAGINKSLWGSGMEVQMLDIAKEIVEGRRLEKGEDCSFLLTADLDELCEGADYIRKNLCGKRADLCAIINGKSGACSENCKFCSQSAHHHTTCQRSDFIDEDEILAGCKEAWENGVNRYCIVTAGRAISDSDFNKALSAYRKMHEKYPDMILCASHGFVSEEKLKLLKEAGVSMYHENIETSKENFPNVCTTHGFDDKIREIKKIQEAGLELCTGGIVGMGEDWNDRISMAFTLKELGIRSIPINILIPVKGTPFGELEPMTREDILRTVAILRYVNPKADIRIAAGKNYFDDGGSELFKSGVNAALTGNLLTTGGSSMEMDRKVLEEDGYILKTKPEVVCHE